VAVAVALILAVTGGAYSATPLITKVFGIDSGASDIVAKNLGEQVDLTRSVAGFSVKLNRVYADSNRVVIGYTVSGPPGRRVWNFSLGANQIVANGISLPGHGGVGDGPVAQQNAYLQWFDASSLQGSPSNVRLHITFPWIEAMEQVGPLPTAADSPPMQFPPMPPLRLGAVATLAPSGDARSSIRLIRVGGPLSFDVSVPFIPGRVANLQQTVESTAGPVELRQVVVTPSETRLYLRGTGPDIVGTLSLDGWTTDPSKVMQASWATSHGLTAVSYLASLSDKHGQWTFVARPAGENTAGAAWRFRFVVP